MSLLTIKIQKIGLKDAGQCIDPYMTISVKGKRRFSQSRASLLVPWASKKSHVSPCFLSFFLLFALLFVAIILQMYPMWD